MLLLCDSEQNHLTCLHLNFSDVKSGTMLPVSLGRQRGKRSPVTCASCLRVVSKQWVWKVGTVVVRVIHVETQYLEDFRKQGAVT